MRKFVTVALVSLSLQFTPAHAQWAVSDGPATGVTSALFASGNDLYVSGSWAGLWRSSGEGRWRLIMTEFFDNRVDFVAHTRVGLFVRTTDHRAFISRDTGITWSPVNGFTSEVWWMGERGDTTLAIATDGTIGATTDRGASWEVVHEGAPGQSVGDAVWTDRVLAISMVRENGTAFIAIAPAPIGPWKSVENGELPVLYAADGAVYTPLGDGLYKIDSGGASVVRTDAPEGRGRDAWWGVAYVGGRFVGAHYSGLFESFDGVHGWTGFAAKDGLPPSYDVPTWPNGTEDLKSARGELFLRLTDAIYRSSDFGRTWIPENGGPSSRAIRGIVRIDDHLFATTARGLFLSSDNGRSWISRGCPSATTCNLDRIAVQNDVLYVSPSGSRGVYRSRDRGDTWEVLPVDGDSSNAYALAGVFDSLLVVGQFSTGDLFFSNDGGIAWTRYHPTLDGGSVFPLGAVWLLSRYNEVNEATLYRSTDHGVTWSDEGQAYGWVNIWRQEGGKTYMGSDAGLFTSVDSGLTWTSRTARLGGIGLDINGLTTRGTRIYTSSIGGGVITSSNDQREWYLFDEGFPRRAAPYAFERQWVDYLYSDDSVIIASSTVGVWTRNPNEPGEYRLIALGDVPDDRGRYGTAPSGACLDGMVVRLPEEIRGGAHPARVEVYTILGELIRERDDVEISNGGEIRLECLPVPGLYLLRVTSGTRQWSTTWMQN